MTTDERYMAMALEEARMAFDKGEVPVGAVIVSRGRVIGRGHNMTETLTDVTAHAEMLALTAACNTTGGKYLPDCTMYVTVEPCTMCTGALGWSQIGRIVYGAADKKRGYFHTHPQTNKPDAEHPKTDKQRGVHPQTDKPGGEHPLADKSSALHPKTIVEGGVCEEECAQLMKDFFRKLR